MGKVVRLKSWGTKGAGKPAPSLLAKARGFRSGTELKIAQQLEINGVEVKYELYKIDYIKPESKHKYTPDFLLPNGIIIEVKGIFDVDDRKKHLLIQKQYPGLDIRFVFSNAKQKLRKNSKTTYAMWCQKHNFKYADKCIPDAWLKETKTSTYISKLHKLLGIKEVKNNEKDVQLLQHEPCFNM